MEKEQILFGGISIGLVITLFILHVLFITPFQQNGLIYSFLLLISCILEALLLGWIKNFYAKKSNREVLTGKIHISSYYRIILTISVILSVLSTLLICVLPSVITPTGLTAEDISLYSLLELADSPEGIIFLMQFILIPGLYTATIIMGTYSFSGDF